MCRLYGFCATEPTKVECTLVHAQNALMAQSRSDIAGKSHAHGWGVATYDADKPHVERQAWAAYHGEHFARAASRIYSNVVMAHVRRATVGVPHIDNTHPFSYGDWVFAHNGTAPFFDQIRTKMLAAIAAKYRDRINGETDSEHIFYFLLTELEKEPGREPQAAMEYVISVIEKWIRDIEERAKIGLNLMLTNGQQFVGSRFGRSLYFVERDGIYDCEICGFPHIHHDPNRDYRALIVASEPITDEDWQAIPDRSIWHASADKPKIAISPLRTGMA